MRILLILIALLMCELSARADDKVWKARVTVETADGQKSQTVCSFMAENGALLPFKFGTYGPTTLRITPQSPPPDRQNQEQAPVFDKIYYALTRSALLSSRDNSLYADEIFSACLPVVLGKDQQLLKCPEGTVTVRLSGSEETE